MHGIGFGESRLLRRHCWRQRRRQRLKEKRPCRETIRHILFALDRHFDDDRISPADVDRWDELKRQVVRMKEGLDLALTVLVSGAPANEEKVRRALEHVRYGLGERESERK